MSARDVRFTIGLIIVTLAVAAVQGLVRRAGSPPGSDQPAATEAP